MTDVRKLLIKSVVQKLGDKIPSSGDERIVNQRSGVTDVRKLLIKSVGQKLGDKIRSVGGQNLYARPAAQKDFTLPIGLEAILTIMGPS